MRHLWCLGIRFLGISGETKKYDRHDQPAFEKHDSLLNAFDLLRSKGRLPCQDRTPADVSVAPPAFRTFPPARGDGFRCRRRRTAIHPAFWTLNAVAQGRPIPAFRPYRVRFSVVGPKPAAAPWAFEIPVFAP